MKTYLFRDVNVLGKKVTFHIEAATSVESLYRLVGAIEVAEKHILKKWRIGK